MSDRRAGPVPLRRRWRRWKRRTRRTRRTAARLGWALLAVVVVAIGITMALQARTAKNNVAFATAAAQQLQQAVVSGNQAEVSQAFGALQVATAKADSAIGGPLWSVGTHVPWVGDDISAVRTTTGSLRLVVDEALPPLLAGQGLRVEQLLPRDGRVDLAAVADLDERVTRARPALLKARARLASIDSDRLMGLVSGPVVEARDRVSRAAEVADGAVTALDLATGLLGAERERRIAVVFQTNAEIRATGGIPGAYAVVTAQDGAIDIVQQGAGSSFGAPSTPVVRLSRFEKDVFGLRAGQYFQNINLNPDFPRSSELAVAFFRTVKDTDIDAVVSIDPVALSYVLKGLGPIDVKDGILVDSTNAVDVLLNKAYFAFADAEVQDNFFSDAANRIFKALVTGPRDPVTAVSGLVRGIEERRVLVWSDDSAEQQLIEENAVSGALPRTPSRRPELGLYLNDRTGGKMQYYLTYDTKVATTKCWASGRQQLRLTTAFRSTAPVDVDSLPASVIGPTYAAKAGTQVIEPLLYLPFGGSVVSARLGGKDVDYSLHRDAGRTVLTMPFTLAPQQARELVVVVRSGPRQPGTTHLVTTPGARPGTDQSVARSTCTS